MSLTHYQRLQAAIIGRVAFHPQLCWNLEHVCNLWMGSWECWLGFRHEHHLETPLSFHYYNWFSGCFRKDCSLATNLSILYDNILLLETLPLELQREIYANAPAVTLPKLLLSFNIPRVPEEMAVGQTGGG